jgi:hypothetical protein
MTQHWSFFRDGDTSFGMFYPKHYTLAGFADARSADRAATALKDDGIAFDDVRVVSGDILVQELQSRDDAGWLERMKARVAEFLGTETYFIDQDVSLAQNGGAFLFVYTPDGSPRERIEEILRAHDPVYARRYGDAVIERVIEPPQPYSG